ncbi:MAG: diguanylate cyclase [Clostridia bacterium]|nr:diguanylate cyclase [Clostridia bacterium]
MYRFIEKKKNTASGQALRISVIYLLVGSLWILLSDKVIEWLFLDPHTLILASLLKGWFYVLASACLIYLLVRTALIKIAQTNLQLSKANRQLADSSDEYRQLYHEYVEKEALLKAMINSIPDLVFYKDPDSNYLGCNKAFEKFVGKTELDIIGKNDYDLFDQAVAESFRRMDQEMLSQHQSHSNEEYVTYPDDTVVCLDTLKTPYYDTSGQVIGLIGISRDITSRKQHEDEVKYLNYHDSLTGLYNRPFFQEELARLDTPRQLPLSIIIGDINGLKLINDAVGHDEGDKLLVNVARILKSNCRSDDIIARTGGDEFWILLPKTDSEGARLVVERIKKSCHEYSREQENDAYYVDISLGFATKQSPEESFAKIRNDAETYMYKRKLLETRSLHSSIIASIKTTLFEKSNETEAHATRLATMTKQLGQALGLSEDDLVALELFSTLHDIGKISIDREILTKPGRLSDEEWDEIKKHPEVGYRIAQASPELRPISELILTHHERWDGQGYPQGLSGEKIPLLARILAVADAFDAMTEDRSYRPALPREQAIAEIRRNSGVQFDPEITELFLRLIENGST